MRNLGTILVVEDDAAMRDVLRRYFQTVGYRVMAVERGQDAVEAAVRLRPRVALVDVFLPDMSGWEVLRRIRERVPGLPVAMMTGYPSAEVRETAAAMKVGELVTKPFELDELAELVAGLCGTPSQLPAGRSGAGPARREIAAAAAVLGCAVVVWVAALATAAPPREKRPPRPPWVAVVEVNRSGTGGLGLAVSESLKKWPGVVVDPRAVEEVARSLHVDPSGWHNPELAWRVGHYTGADYVAVVAERMEGGRRIAGVYLVPVLDGGPGDPVGLYVVADASESSEGLAHRLAGAVSCVLGLERPDREAMSLARRP